MTPEYIKHLLDFHYWARDRTLAAVAALSTAEYEQQMGNSFSSVRETLTHIYQAEGIWFGRWTGESPTSFPDAPAERDELTSNWRELETKVRRLLDLKDDATLAVVMPYRLLNGTEAASPFWQMIVHVANHATYHRGQITTMLRQLGAAPPKSTDMITFFRETAAR